MARQLYRIYLYVVSIALLVFAAVGLFLVLSSLLSFTPLRGSERSPETSVQLVQQTVFAVVSWVIAGLLGGVHYRLIRRDIANDPSAGSGAVRSFILNAAQAIAALVTIFSLSGAFGELAVRDPNFKPDSASSFALAAAALVVTVVLEWERGRTAVAPGPATIFQRLHLYGVPAVLLLSLPAGGGIWDNAMRNLVATLLMQAKAFNPLDPRACLKYPPEPLLGPCMLPNVGFLWLGVLVVVAGIAAYAWLVRGDLHSMIRTIAHLGSFGFGLIFVVIGVDLGLELLLRLPLRVPVAWSLVAHPWFAAYDFISPLTVGLLVSVAYGLWLRSEAAGLPLAPTVLGLSAEALAATIVSVPFFLGLGKLLYAVFEWIATGHLVGRDMAEAEALMLTGIVGLALAWHLRIRTRQTGRSAPLRAYVLAGLAAGVVTSAAGLAVALYALGTALLRAALANWQQVARMGAAALVVGLILVGTFGWVVVHGRYLQPVMARLSGATTRTATATGVPQAARPAAQRPAAPETSETIGHVLDEYAAHTITREEAMARLRELTTA